MDNDHNWRYNRQPPEEDREKITSLGWISLGLLLAIVLLGAISRESAHAGHIIDWIWQLLYSDLPN